jgi:hypothetical protein
MWLKANYRMTLGTPQLRRFKNFIVTTVVLYVVTVVGLLIGWNNIHSAGTVPWQFGFWLVASACLGFAFPRISWLCPAIFAYSMYCMHVWAIRHGYQPPFVETNEARAEYWLFDGIVPMMAGMAAGAIRFVFREARRAVETGGSLPYTEYRIAHSAKGGLLRASSKPEATHDDLLRPSRQAPAPDRDELLKPSRL